MISEKILKSADKFHINLGIQRVKLMLALLDNPQKKYKIIHVAGTNGKGSTCKIINDILIKHFENTDKKIGLYTSPHLFSYCERIKINNIDIKENIFDRLIFDLDKFAKKNNISLTEFELLTTTALYYFYIKKVDYVILETGLGGRLDATNTVEPILEIITTIDFDHVDRLGNTINKIAFEKAGIIKQNSKVIVARDNQGFEVIEKVASSKNAQILKLPKLELKDNFVIYKNEKIKFNLHGSHQIKNLALALCAIENIGFSIDIKEIKSALEKIKWKYRLDFISPNLLLDCAHNPSGIRTLVKYLENISQEKNIVFGCLKTKDYNTMSDLLLSVKNIKNYYFFEFDYPNALKFDELDMRYKNIFKKIEKSDIEKIIKDKNLTVITGSIYMLGSLFEERKIDWEDIF